MAVRLSAGMAEALAKMPTAKMFGELEYREYGIDPAIPKVQFGALSLDWSGRPNDEFYALVTPETRFLKIQVSNAGKKSMDVARLTAAVQLKVLVLRLVPATPG